MFSSFEPSSGFKSNIEEVTINSWKEADLIQLCKEPVPYTEDFARKSLYNLPFQELSRFESNK